MYKPVPQLVQIDKGEDSESEWIGNSSAADTHDQYKLPQQLDGIISRNYFNQFYF